ncbi:alpha/beta hydrolase [Streptomyces dangxiongensis]
MSLDPQIDALLKELAEGGQPAPESRTVKENRDLASSLSALAGDVEPVGSVHDAVAAAEGLEVPVRIYTPATVPRSGPLPVTVFFHGGGWVLGDLDSQDHIARIMANRSGTIVVSVDYRLAPEHRFPAGFEDAYAALTWVAANAGGFGGDGQNIAVFGESAGGNLTAALVQEAQRRGGPRIALQVLAYPAVDRFDDSPSMYENMAGPLLSRGWLEWFWGLYLNTPDEGGRPARLAGPLRRPDRASSRRHRHRRTRPAAGPGRPLRAAARRRRRAGRAPPGQGRHPRVLLVHRVGAALTGRLGSARKRRGHGVQRLTRPALPLARSAPRVRAAGAWQRADLPAHRSARRRWLAVG